MLFRLPAFCSVLDFEALLSNWQKCVDLCITLAILDTTPDTEKKISTAENLGLP